MCSLKCQHLSLAHRFNRRQLTSLCNILQSLRKLHVVANLLPVLSRPFSQVLINGPCRGKTEPCGLQTFCHHERVLWLLLQSVFLQLTLKHTMRDPALHFPQKEVLTVKLQTLQVCSYQCQQQRLPGKSTRRKKTLPPNTDRC